MNSFRIILLIVLLSCFSSLQAETTNVPLQPTPQQQHNPAIQTPHSGNAEEPELLDIKGPIEIPESSRTKILLTMAALAALALLIALCFLWWKRTRRQQAALAHETALQRLLDAQQLIEGHKVKAFVTLIDQTLRSYIEQRFAVSARRQTTREFISRITEGTKTVPEPLAHNKTRLQTWLERCDMVKFARADLKTETMEIMLANLRAFIESTRMEAKK